MQLLVKTLFEMCASGYVRNMLVIIMFLPLHSPFLSIGEASALLRSCGEIETISEGLEVIGRSRFL